MRNTLRILCLILCLTAYACGQQSEVTEVATISPSTTMVEAFYALPISQTTTTAAPTTTVLPAVTTRQRVKRSPTTSHKVYASSVNVWDEMARCESGGRWNLNSGNGYYGGLQMDMTFWRTYGRGVAARPDLATREQQIAAAERARDSGRGYSPWPSCRREVGV